MWRRWPKACRYLETSSNRSATACKPSRSIQRPICPDKCIHIQIHSRVFHRIQNKFQINFLKKLQLCSVTDERGVAGGWHSGQIEYSRTASRLKVRQLLDRWNLSPPSDAKILSPSPNTAARVQTWHRVRTLLLVSGNAMHWPSTWYLVPVSPMWSLQGVTSTSLAVMVCLRVNWIEVGRLPSASSWPYPAWINASSKTGLSRPNRPRPLLSEKFEKYPIHQNTSRVPKDPTTIPAKAAHRTMIVSSSIAANEARPAQAMYKNENTHTHTTEQNNWSVSVLMRALPHQPMVPDKVLKALSNCLKPERRTLTSIWNKTEITVH